jgi:hypothetical protein
MLGTRMIHHVHLRGRWIQGSPDNYYRKLQRAVFRSPMDRANLADFEAARRPTEDPHPMCAGSSIRPMRKPTRVERTTEGFYTRSAVAGAARMMATGAVLVVIGALVTAVHTTIPLDGFVDTHDANAVATCALDHFNCHAHRISPVFDCFRSRTSEPAVPTLARDGWRGT